MPHESAQCLDISDVTTFDHISKNHGVHVTLKQAEPASPVLTPYPIASPASELALSMAAPIWPLSLFPAALPVLKI